jgi:hypothetical protein
MRILRRKQMPERLREPHAAFEAQAERVETARKALLGCLPTGRVAHAPVPVGLELLRDELAEVREELDAWRVPEIEERWQACARAVDVALERIPAGIERAEQTDEAGVLLNVVSQVVGPLDAWASAERAWLKLRE